MPVPSTKGSIARIARNWRSRVFVVVINLCALADPGRSICRSAGLSVDRWVGRSVGRSAYRSVDRFNHLDRGLYFWSRGTWKLPFALDNNSNTWNDMIHIPRFVISAAIFGDDRLIVGSPHRKTVLGVFYQRCMPYSLQAILTVSMIFSAQHVQRNTQDHRRGVIS